MRKSWNEYLIDLALDVTTRSTCDRAFAGCVLVNSDNRIVSTGYNSAISGDPRCDKVGHTLCDRHCIVTIRTEMNALLYYTKGGIIVRGCICCVTHFPCLNCTKPLIQVGINKIYYYETYCVDEYAIELLDRNNTEYVQIQKGAIWIE